MSIVGASVAWAVVRIEGTCPLKRAGHHATSSPLATLDARAAGRRDTLSIGANHAAGLRPVERVNRSGRVEILNASNPCRRQQANTV